MGAILSALFLCQNSGRRERETVYPYQPYFNQQTQYQRTEVVKVNATGGGFKMLGKTACAQGLASIDGGNEQ